MWVLLHNNQQVGMAFLSLIFENLQVFVQLKFEHEGERFLLLFLAVNN